MLKRQGTRLTSTERYGSIARCVLILFAIIAWGCEKSDKLASKSRKQQDIRQKSIGAFFSSPFKSIGQLNGFWTVDRKTFTDFIENSYLGSYKPLPNEPSASKIRANMKDAHYYLRIDGLQCDELFFVENGQFLVSAGTMKLLEKSAGKMAYQVIFGRRGKKGKKSVDSAILTFDTLKKRIDLDFPERKMVFYKEMQSAAELLKRFAKPEFTTGLAEY